ncbi:MAG TPA: c-type cytochrome [Candidatus Angelobacter sp.]|jgi:mono/diheme cytochrome c family protein|nr:c-type cytochrome [Candidatus Angelobacter sp.]
MFAALLLTTALTAQTGTFHNAPAAAEQTKNPYSGDAQAAAAGKKLYAQNCAQCHGNNLQGMGPAPTLISNSVKHATPGDLFWFVTNGDLNKGMPAWLQLTKQQRWQIVSFVESRNAGQ